MPRFWIVAGPNGSGKSTLVDSGALDRILGPGLTKLNADIRTRQILEAKPDTPNANLLAAIEIDNDVAACIDIGTDCLVETVLLSDKYLGDIDRASRLSFELGLMFVCLATPRASIRRVSLRRALGGHDVPSERIIARWYRSIAMLGRIAHKMHRVYVFDNTGAESPVLIASKEAGILRMHAPGRIPEIDAVLTRTP